MFTEVVEYGNSRECTVPLLVSFESIDLYFITKLPIASFVFLVTTKFEIVYLVYEPEVVSLISAFLYLERISSIDMDMFLACKIIPTHVLLFA